RPLSTDGHGRRRTRQRGTVWDAVAGRRPASKAFYGSAPFPDRSPGGAFGAAGCADAPRRRRAVGTVDDHPTLDGGAEPAEHGGRTAAGLTGGAMSQPRTGVQRQTV